MTAKLRRGEPFSFSWRDDASIGGGKTSVWVRAGSPIAFKYGGSRQPSLNRNWIEALASTANSPTGLYLVPEPTPTTTPTKSFSADSHMSYPNAG